MESSKNGVSKKLVFGLGCVSVIFLCVIIVTLVVFVNNQKNNGEQFYDSGSVVMTYAENSNIFFINNMSILDDESGKTNMVSGQYYDFTVNAELGDSKQTDYEIVLKIDNNFTSIDSKDVKVYFEKQESGSYVPVLEPISFDSLSSKSKCGAPKNSKILTKVSNTKSSVNNYRLRMWVDSNTTLTLDTVNSFGIEINVYGKSE